MNRALVIGLVIALLMAAAPSGAATPLVTPAATGALPPDTPSGIPSSCPVTHPNGVDAPNIGWGQWYGENGLYATITLDREGSFPVTYSPDRPGARNRDKQFWASDPPEAMTIAMTFAGRRTSPGAPTLQSFPSSHEGTPFLDSQIWFPEPGCWQFTLSTPTRALTIVTWVSFPFNASSTVFPELPAVVIPPTCPVTHPNHVAPDPDVVSNWQTNEWQGENGLFIRLKDDGTFGIVADPAGPGGWNKQFWAHIPREPITVTESFIGTRTTSDPLPAFTNDDTSSFMVVIPATFPEPGCYRITGTTPTRSLTVVVWVYRYA